MKQKNILIFGHGYATQFIDISNQYTRLFDKNHYQVTVVYLVGSGSEEIRQRHLADQVIFLNSPKKSVRHLKIDAIKKMAQLCRDKNFDTVICHRYKPTYIMLWAARKISIPLIISVMHELGTLKSLARKLLIALLAKNNIIFAGVSNAVRDDLRNSIWRIPPERVITLYNMLDVDLTEPQLLSRAEARKQLHLSNDDFIYGNIGRLAINKDQQTLIRAFAKIKNQYSHAKLLIMGEGELEISLKNLAQQLGVANDVIWTGFMKDAFRYMKAFDVYISSSTQEAFGRVLLEAMVAKIPIIATRVNGVPEVVDDSGVLIEAGNVLQMAAEMSKATQNDLVSWGQKGYQRLINHFSLQRFNEIFWQLREKS